MQEGKEQTINTKPNKFENEIVYYKATSDIKKTL